MAEHCPWCGCSSMVEQQPSKLMTRVRFPSPAPIESRASCLRDLPKKWAGKVRGRLLAPLKTKRAPAAVAARGLPWAIEAAGLMPRRRLDRRLFPGQAHRRLEAVQAGQAVVQMAVDQRDESLVPAFEIGARLVQL